MGELDHIHRFLREVESLEVNADLVNDIMSESFRVGLSIAEHGDYNHHYRLLASYVMALCDEHQGGGYEYLHYPSAQDHVLEVITNGFVEVYSETHRFEVRNQHGLSQEIPDDIVTTVRPLVFFPDANGSYLVQIIADTRKSTLANQFSMVLFPAKAKKADQANFNFFLPFNTSYEWMKTVMQQDSVQHKKLCNILGIYK